MFHSVSKWNLFKNTDQQSHQASDGRQKREWAAGRALARERHEP
jgi:hypothetical protein